MKKLIKNNLITHFIILSCLLLVWFTLTFFQILSNDGSLSVVTQKYSQNDFPNMSYDAILAGEKRVFEFTAEHDNLGFISIHFDMSNRGREDYISLKMYEKESGKIIKEETTFAGAFQGLNFYPFGFPIILDSKGRVYIVEIKSKHGTPKNYVAIKDAKTIFSTSYQYDKSLIFSDISYFIPFVMTKGINATQNNFLLFTSSVYLYPFIFYLIWLIAKRYIIKILFFYNPLVMLLSITVVTDIFFVDGSFDLVFFLISVMWGGLLLYLKKGSKDSYKVALALLILCPILQVLGQDLMVEKAAAWAFLALTVGVIINLYELKKHPEEFED